MRKSGKETRGGAASFAAPDQNFQLKVQDEAIRLFAEAEGYPRMDFEDIAQLDDRTVQMLIRELRTETLACALMIGASKRVKEKFLANMSNGARDLLMEMMGFMRKPTLAAGSIAKTEIIAKAAGLPGGRRR